MVDALETAALPEPDEALRAYVRAKRAIADLVRGTKRALGFQGGEDPRVDALLSGLAEDRFNLVVLGEFKRGKTSLINAILGRALLPASAEVEAPAAFLKRGLRLVDTPGVG